MVAPIVILETVQVALETTRGTLVPATKVLDFTEATLKRDPNNSHIRVGGSFATSHRTIPGREDVELNIKGRCTYQWMNWWYNLFLGPLASGTGAGADKTWTFGSTVVSDTADNLKSASFEIGGSDTWPSEFKVAGVIGKKLSLHMEVDGTWTYDATLLGTTVTKASKTGALSKVTTIFDILGQNTKCYFDTSSAFGTTQKTGVMQSVDIDIEIGGVQRYALDGTRAPIRTAVVHPRNITGKFVAEWATITNYDNTMNQTANRLRFEALGTTLGTATYKSNIDIPCTYDTLDFSDDDGVITEEVAFTAQYDSTPAADINAVVVNDSATLPA